MLTKAQFYAFFLLFSTFSLIPFPFSFCPLTSTKDYVRKNKLFMQNKANFRKSQMNVNKVLTRDYEKKDTWWSGKKQSQTNPNKAKSKKAKMNVIYYITKGYENKSNWAICENEPKTNPNKTNQSQYMLLICATLKVLENSIITSYHLEPVRPINV